jgi:hypothetical protein
LSHSSPEPRPYRATVGRLPASLLASRPAPRTNQLVPAPPRAPRGRRPLRWPPHAAGRAARKRAPGATSPAARSSRGGPSQRTTGRRAVDRLQTPRRPGAARTHPRLSGRALGLARCLPDARCHGAGRRHAWVDMRSHAADYRVCDARSPLACPPVNLLHPRACARETQRARWEAGPETVSDREAASVRTRARESERVYVRVRARARARHSDTHLKRRCSPVGPAVSTRTKSRLDTDRLLQAARCS